MRKKGTILLLLCFLLFAGENGLPVAKAGTQYDDPGDNDTIEDDPDTQEVPIDGGLAFLLLVGAGYGVKKYKTGLVNQRKGEMTG